MAEVSTRTEIKAEGVKVVVNRFLRLMLMVSDMPRAKAFYTDRLGLKVMQDYCPNLLL